MTTEQLIRIEDDSIVTANVTVPINVTCLVRLGLSTRERGNVKLVPSVFHTSAYGKLGRRLNRSAAANRL